MEYRNPFNEPKRNYPRQEFDQFCTNYSKHYSLIVIGEFNKWTALACGLIVLGGVIVASMYQ
jgi:hypothetical protein